jgi:hypothetical protein
MTKNTSGYEQIMEEVYRKDGAIRKVGFREGKWIVKTKYDRVAVSKKGFLLYFEYNETGQVHFYELFTSFTEMAADKFIDTYLLDQVAAAIGADYIAYAD